MSEKQDNSVLDPKKKHISKIVPGIDERIKNNPIELEKEYARLRRSHMESRAERSVHESKYGKIRDYSFFDQDC